MASAASCRTIFEDLYLCSVCLQPSENPKLLPCLHSFCRGCLCRHFQIDVFRFEGSAFGADSSSSAPSPRLTCPACRTVVVVPGGKVSCFNDDTSAEFTKAFLAKYFGIINIEDFANENECDEEECGNEKMEQASQLREKLRQDIKKVQHNLVELRSKTLYIAVLTDHLNRVKKNQTEVIGESEPVNHAQLLKELDDSFRPVMARLADWTQKLYKVACDQKAVYGLVEELVEKGSSAQLLAAHDPLSGLIQDSHAPLILLGDLQEMVADIKIDLTYVDKEVHKSRADDELVLHPLKSAVLDVSKRLICRLSRCGDKPGQFNAPVHATFMPNGGFLVCDKKNHRIQIFDCMGRFNRQFMRGRIKPRRARVNTKDGLLYVSDEHTETVKVYTMEGELIRSLGENFFLCPAGLDFDTEGNVIVSDAEKATVSIHSCSKDKRINKFCFAYFQPKVPCPYFAACSNEDHIVVSDYRNNTVRGFTTNGRELFCISDLQCPRGVCVDKNGNILIAEGDGHRVSLYSPYGKFHQYVLTKTDGLNFPMSVDIDDDLRVLVTQCGLYNNHEVMMFQLTY